MQQTARERKEKEKLRPANDQKQEHFRAANSQRQRQLGAPLSFSPQHSGRASVQSLGMRESLYHKDLSAHARSHTAVSIIVDGVPCRG